MHRVNNRRIRIEARNLFTVNKMYKKMEKSWNGKGYYAGNKASLDVVIY